MDEFHNFEFNICMYVCLYVYMYSRVCVYIEMAQLIMLKFMFGYAEVKIRVCVRVFMCMVVMWLVWTYMHRNFVVVFLKNTYIFNHVHIHTHIHIHKHRYNMIVLNWLKLDGSANHAQVYMCGLICSGKSTCMCVCMYSCI